MENDVKELIKDIDKQIKPVIEDLESPNNPSKKLRKDIEKQIENYKEKNDKDIKDLITYIDGKVKGNAK